MKKKKFPKTLNGIWKECLRMWKDITEIFDYDAIGDLYDDIIDYIIDLKNQWIEQNGYDLSMVSSCFFCDWNFSHNSNDTNCKSCPGRLVDKDFACERKEYHYVYKPHEFYKKLVELNKKRKEKQ